MRARFVLLIAGLLVRVLGSAEAATCPAYDETQHASGCAQVSVSPGVVRPGDTLTVSIQLNCGGASVFASYAQQEGILVDGVAMTGSGGPPPNYHGTAVYPDGGFQVPISGNGGHTVVFRIREDAPDKCVSSDQFGAYGPWVSVGSGSSWSTPVDFAIDRAANRSVSLQMGAATPRPGEARPGDKITYTLAATCDSKADTLDLAVPLPSGTVLVPGSITGGGTFKSGHLKWRFENTVGQSVEFQAQVREAKALKKIDTIVANGRATATFPGKTASDSVRVETKVAKPTQIRGRILDAKLQFPKKTSIDENDPLGFARVELVDGVGTIIDSEVADGGGRYEVDAGDPGTYTLRVTVKADVYASASNQVNVGGVDLVQEREVTVTDLKAPPQVVDILVPRGILDHAAKTLFRLNNLSYAAAGFVPTSYRMHTVGIEQEIDLLLDAKDAYFRSTEAHAPNGWDALARFSAVASTMPERFRDMAVAVDDLAKIVPTAILINLMQQNGAKFAEKYGGEKFKQTGQLPPPTAGTRSIEALKIFSLSYVVGNVLPPLLDRLGVTGEVKGLVIEIVYKAVRFGLNSFVPGMNAGDAVFEVILQTTRTAIFAALIAGVQVDLQAEVNHAFEKLAQRTVAGDHATVLAALDLFDARVANRNKLLHAESTAALAAISQAIRGAEGVAFKLQSAFGLVKDPNALQKGLKKALTPVTKVLGAAKNKLFIPFFAAGGAMAAGTMVLTPIDLESEVAGAFLGFAPGQRPVDLDLNRVDDWYKSFKKHVGFGDDDGRRRSASGLAAGPTEIGNTASAAKSPQVPPGITEIAALVDRLDAITAVITANDVAGYGGIVDAIGDDFEDFAAIVVPLIDESFAAPWGSDDRYGAFVSRTLRAVQSLVEAIAAADAWAVEPTKPLASAALKTLKTARTDLLAAGQAADAVLPALAAAAPGPKLLVTIVGLLDGAPANADVVATIEIRNVGNAPMPGATLEVETTPGLTIVDPPVLLTGTVEAGAAIALPITVHTPANAPVLVGLTATVTEGAVPLAGADAVFVVGE